METKKYNSCQACGFDNAANAKYCEKCGTLLGGAWPARGVNRRGIPGSGTRMRWLFVLLPILVIVGLYLVSSVGTSGPASNLFVAGEYVTTNTSNPLFYVNFTIPSGYDGNIYGEFLSNASTSSVSCTYLRGALALPKRNMPCLCAGISAQRLLCHPDLSLCYICLEAAFCRLKKHACKP